MGLEVISTKDNSMLFDSESMKRMTDSVHKGFYSSSFKFSPDDYPDDESSDIDIDMLRTGKFLRKFFFFEQIITIDENMIDTMIKNFNEGVVSEKIQLDTNHGMSESYGWLKSLRKEYRDVNGRQQCFLIGTWSLNSEGIKLIKKQQYKYFSIEFYNNYSKREVMETVKTPEGREEPAGAMIKYGPTITGGALTNRPFIPNLGEHKYKFSDDGKNMSANIPEFFTLEKYEEDNNSSAAGKPVVKIPRNRESTNFIDFSSFSATNPTKEKPTMGLEQSKKILKMMKDQLSTAEAGSEKYNNLSSNITALEAEIQSTENDISALNQVNQKAKESLEAINTKYVSLETKLNEVSADVMISKETARQATINEYCTNLLSTSRLPKPVVDRVRSVLIGNKEGAATCFSDSSTNTEMKFSSLKDSINYILEAIPSTYRVPTGDKATTELNERPSAAPAADSDSKLSQTIDELIDNKIKSGSK